MKSFSNLRLLALLLLLAIAPLTNACRPKKDPEPEHPPVTGQQGEGGIPVAPEDCGDGNC